MLNIKINGDLHYVDYVRRGLFGFDTVSVDGQAAKYYIPTKFVDGNTPDTFKTDDGLKLERVH